MIVYKKIFLLFLLNIILCLTLSCKFSIMESKELTPYKYLFSKNEPILSVGNHQFEIDLLEQSFPEVLKGLKLFNLEINRESYSVTAFYGEHNYKIRITDALQNKLQIINTFNEKYASIVSNSSDKRQIATVRDGYKSITTIEKDSISISFVFKKRYLFEVTSYQHDTPYKVWRFLELSNFKTLSY